MVFFRRGHHPRRPSRPATPTEDETGLGRARGRREVRSPRRPAEADGEVEAHGAVVFRVRPLENPTEAAPHATLDVTGLANVTAGQPVTVTESFTNYGDLAAKRVELALTAPAGWSVTPTSPTSFAAVETGQTVRATFEVTAPPTSRLFQIDQVGAMAAYTWAGRTPQNLAVTTTVTRSSPVLPPLTTFASTTAAFSQVGDALGSRAAGSDVYGGTNQYGAIYRPGGYADGSTAVVRVVSQSYTNAWAKAGIMVRNDITASATSPGFLILAVTPGHGYVVQWDANGDGRLESNSAPNNEGLGTAVYPSYLKLERSGTTYTGSYSVDGVAWTWIATVTVPSAAATQDVGVFMTSHASGTVGETDFDGFSVGPAA